MTRSFASCFLPRKDLSRRVHRRCTSRTLFGRLVPQPARSRAAVGTHPEHLYRSQRCSRRPEIEIVGAIQLNAVPAPSSTNHDIDLAASCCAEESRNDLAQPYRLTVRFSLDSNRCRSQPTRTSRQQPLRRGGIAELGHIPVGRIADHQRDALCPPARAGQPAKSARPSRRCLEYAHQKTSKSAMKTELTSTYEVDLSIQGALRYPVLNYILPLVVDPPRQLSARPSQHPWSPVCSLLTAYHLPRCERLSRSAVGFVRS